MCDIGIWAICPTSQKQHWRTKHTRFIPTCYVILKPRIRIKLGRLIQRTSQWQRGFVAWLLLSTGIVAKYCLGACRTIWIQAFVLKLSQRRFSNTGRSKSSIQVKAANMRAGSSGNSYGAIKWHRVWVAAKTVGAMRSWNDFSVA